MAVDHKLPQPGPNQKEIQFRRLLLQVEKQFNRRNSQEGDEDWQRNLKLHSVSDQLAFEKPGAGQGYNVRFLGSTDREIAGLNAYSRL